MSRPLWWCNWKNPPPSIKILNSTHFSWGYQSDSGEEVLAGGGRYTLEHDTLYTEYIEYHTSDITLARLEQLILDLCEGKLEHSRILREGGHGAFVRRSFGFDAVEVIIATGPRRRLVEASKLPMVYGAPFGDNMMTGTVGLLEAVRRRKGLEPINYI